MTTQRPYTIYINRDSGTVLKLGEEALSAIITDGGLPVENLEFVAGGDLGARVESHDTARPLLIGGGDGTIRVCAESALQSNKKFGILPLGTMNLLGRDLGIPYELPAAVAAYKHGAKVRKIDVATVNGRVFLCCAGIGIIPESSEFREQNRTANNVMLIPRLTLFVLDQMGPHNRRRFRMRLDNRAHRVHTTSLVIANNRFARETMPGDIGIARNTLEGGCLGIYAASPATQWDKIRLLWRLRFGNWRGDAVIREWIGKTAMVETGNSEELISLDGETETLSSPLEFKIMPRALEILVPIAEDESSKG